MQRVRIGPVDLPADPDFAQIDARLEELFGAHWNHLETPRRPSQSADAETATAKGIGERVLAVAAYLQLSARIPVLSSGQLLKLFMSGARTAPRWTFDANVPRVAGVAQSITLGAFRCAIRTLQWCSQADAGAQPAWVQEELDRKFVKPASRALSETGKSGISIATGAFLAGIPFEYIGSGQYLLGWGSKSLRTQRSSIATDSLIGSKLATSKSAATWQLRLAGLPVPDHRLVKSDVDSLAAASELGWPVVVKPNDRERGEGVSVNIGSEAGLSAAFARARKFSSRVLVEKHVAGVCHRVLVVRGHVLMVVKRNPQQVEGDGKRSIAELIDAKNHDNLRKAPWARAAAWPAASELIDWLASRGLTPESVPAADEAVSLRPIESVTWGGHSELVTEHMHAENADLCIRAAALLGIDVAGVDLITRDIAVPWYENGGVVNEVNHAPFFAVKPERKHLLRQFVEALLPAGGRIPVDLVIGDELALERGRELQQKRCAKAMRCYLVSATSTLRPDGSQLGTTATGLYERTRALLLDPRVDAIVMVAQDDGLLTTGLPVDRLALVDTTFAAGHPWAQKLAAWASRFRVTPRGGTSTPAPTGPAE